MNLIEYAKTRDTLLERIVQTLEADPRVKAAWLSGSFGRGEADEWSDLDLHVAVDDAWYEQFLAEREAVYHHVGHPVLIQPDMASDSQVGARFQLVMYAGPIEVDWNIGPVGKAQRPLAYQMLVERASVPVVAPAPLTPIEREAQAQRRLTFFWAMAPIAIKLCGRGDTRRAANQIELLTTAFIALWRLVSEPHGPNPILPSTNRVIEPELDSCIPRVGATMSPRSALSTVAELCQSVERLHPRLEGLGVTIPRDMPAEVAALRRVADEAIRRGDFPRRPYR